MPHTTFKPAYDVELSGAEYRLVTLALAGKLQDKEDIEDALKLNTQLAKQRAQHIGDAKQQADKALEYAKELESGKP